MQTFRYNVTEHDPEKPWLIRSTWTGLTIEARDTEDFRTLSAREWPPERFTVELMPGELMRALKSRRT
jgi:hypothetical protein